MRNREERDLFEGECEEIKVKIGKNVVVSQEFMLDVAKLVYALDDIFTFSDTETTNHREERMEKFNNSWIELLDLKIDIMNYMLKKIEKAEYREQYQAERKTR